MKFGKNIPILALSILYLFLTNNAQAEWKENIRWKMHKNGKISFWVLWKEKKNYFLEEFEKKPGQLQQKIHSYQDLSKADAIERFEASTTGYTIGALPKALRKENITEVEDESIWVPTRSWDDAWEHRYSIWLASNATSTFLKDHDVATDCADVAYAFRWIFARIHSLPAGNSLVGTKELFTHQSMRASWKWLPTDDKWYLDQRFMAALNYLLQNTYTHSLMDDVYPIEIKQNVFEGGTIFLNLYAEDTGHTEFVQRVIQDELHPEPIRIVASTVPRELRDLSEYGFQGWGYSVKKDAAAFVQFRWPELVSGIWQLREGNQMPRYSLEQFDPDFSEGNNDLAAVVIKKIIPNWNPDLKTALKSRTELLIQRFTDRIAIVNDGYKFCLENGGCAKGSTAYEQWSTPSRDHAIENLIQLVDSIYNNERCNLFCRWELFSKNKYTLFINNNERYTLENAMNIWKEGLYSSDPNETIEARWGISK